MRRPAPSRRRRRRRRGSAAGRGRVLGGRASRFVHGCASRSPSIGGISARLPVASTTARRAASSSPPTATARSPVEARAARGRASMPRSSSQGSWTAVVEVVDDLVAARAAPPSTSSSPRDRLGRARDAARLVERLGRAQQGLRRHARVVGALAADEVALDERDRRPASPRRPAHTSPAGPAPITITSNSAISRDRSGCSRSSCAAPGSRPGRSGEVSASLRRTRRPPPHPRGHVRALGRARVDDDVLTRVAPADRARRVDAVEAGHPDVHQHDIGSEPRREAPPRHRSSPVPRRRSVRPRRASRSMSVARRSSSSQIRMLKPPVGHKPQSLRERTRTMRHMVIDGHNDLVLKRWRGEEGKHIDLETAAEAGFAGGFFALYVPSPYDADPPATPYAMPLRRARSRSTRRRGSPRSCSRRCARCRSAGRASVDDFQRGRGHGDRAHGGRRGDRRGSVEPARTGTTAACARSGSSGRGRTRSPKACRSRSPRRPTPGRG